MGMIDTDGWVLGVARSVAAKASGAGGGRLP
jgi:hypothetical protein